MSVRRCTHGTTAIRAVLQPWEWHHQSRRSLPTFRPIPIDTSPPSGYSATRTPAITPILFSGTGDRCGRQKTARLLLSSLPSFPSLPFPTFVRLRFPLPSLSTLLMMTSIGSGITSTTTRLSTRLSGPYHFQLTAVDWPVRGEDLVRFSSPNLSTHSA